MDTFHIKCKVENVANRTKSANIPGMLVGMGSESTWVSRAVLDKLDIKPEKKDLTFIMANGQTIPEASGLRYFG